MSKSSLTPLVGRLLATLTLALAGLSNLTPSASASLKLDQAFVHPPDSARPWVYWFWLNSNITSNGITADLEALKRVGIGGVLIMEVDQGAPVGPVAFMGPQWRAMFHHVIAEAKRLGLEVNMNDDAGWNGSGGPWIKPEQSMQKVVFTATNLSGPQHFEAVLAQPQTVAGYFRDIVVQAIPTPGAYRLGNLGVKACYQVGGLGPMTWTNLPPEMVIDRNRMLDLSAKMDATGRLVWDVPAGNWTVMRFGHTSTGVENAPAPASGRGLECDKLSKEGIAANFAGMMDKLMADSGAATGKTLVATHIDSWENGAQNWTARMRQEFQRRRGYDLLPFLPVLSGRVVGSAEISERFLWDWRQTISELVVENYAGHARELAHRHGMRLSIEAYGGPCDDLPYGGRADEPMAEFWIGGGAFETVKGMASSVHTYGKPILGAESFTAADQERWLEHPASIKALGDRAFCEGVSRFVFHRYALQPWLDYRPGMTMGPWGLHYERTETWWEQSRPWHEYLARCQFMLRLGKFVADVCFLQPEEAPQGFQPHQLQGYDYDCACAEVVLTRMKVKNGRLVLPDGMSYRLLVLPEVPTMTPALLRQIRSLVQAGATVLGSRPKFSPSLTDYPKCDAEVKRLADELWSSASAGGASSTHSLGKGQVVTGLAPEKLLAQKGVSPDFLATTRLRYLHRATGDAEIYFVANPQPVAVEAVCTFRVKGKRPEFWWPDTGRTEPAAVFSEKDSGTSVVLPLGPSGSVFVVFRQPLGRTPAVVSVSRDGQVIMSAVAAMPKGIVRRAEKVVVQRARYGVLNDPRRTRDVRAKVQHLADTGEASFQVARMAEGDDPAFMVVKTLVVEYTIDGQPATATGTDPDTITLVQPKSAPPVAEVHLDAKGRTQLEAWQPGHYELNTAGGTTTRLDVPTLPAPQDLTGPWQARFPPHWGAPESATFDKLISWSDSPETGIKYFSGTATYTKSFDVPAEMLAKNRRLYLDLGRVQIMAQVKLNGQDLGLLWKPPYLVDITQAAKAGANALEIQVVNLWPNRMIGDEQLPEDSQRNPNGTLKQWPAWVQAGQPSPTGRYTFTSWRLWKKTDALLPSGLLGPVQVRATETVTAP